ncbi:unnamed protein product [Porites evermanni]|uniref:Uncharacterized protein n=1 Tax=Porites evermanni TaxID=104178 RepID=A0ABN8SDP3_9CNID|nr:unnamed protein product [Porites evermanni]
MELVQLKIKNGPNFGKLSMNKEGYANLVQNIHLQIIPSGGSCLVPYRLETKLMVIDIEWAFLIPFFIPLLFTNNKCMKKDLLPVTAGDEEYCLSRLRRRYSAEKNRMYKGCFKGLVIGPNFGKPSMNKEGLFERIARKGRIGAMLDSPGVLRKFCSGARHAVSCTSDDEVVSQAVELVKTADLLWAHLHQPEMFLKGETCNDEGKEDQRWKEVLKSVDSKILQIHQALPKDTLFFVMFGCGDLSLVTRLQKDRKSNKAELKKAVKIAKKGLCFIKIT